MTVRDQMLGRLVAGCMVVEDDCVERGPFNYPVQAVQYANCAGALACTRLGVVEALGTRQAVDAMWQRYYA